MTDSSATVVWQADYLPYGQAQVTISIIENNLRFPGQYYDAESGLHYNWHRYYDPTVGRYLRTDPIGLKGGINLYGYVAGNPINVIDPRGLFWLPRGIPFLEEEYGAWENVLTYRNLKEMVSAATNCISCTVTCVLLELTIYVASEKAEDVAIDAARKLLRNKGKKLLLKLLNAGVIVDDVIDVIQVSHGTIKCYGKCSGK